MNGQELAGELEPRRGSKPTPGTLYPALKALERKKLIKGTRLGGKRTFLLTETGYVRLIQACQYFHRIFISLANSLRSRPKPP